MHLAMTSPAASAVGRLGFVGPFCRRVRRLAKPGISYWVSF